MFVNSDSGAEVETCVVGATDCVAVCDCQEEYMGSETCSVNSTQLLQKQALRDQVIQGIQAMIALEEPDQVTVAGWIGSVVSAAQVPDELSDESISSLLKTVDTVVSSASEAGVTVESVRGVLDCIDASVQASANRVARRRRRLQRGGGHPQPNADTHTTRTLSELASSHNSTLVKAQEVIALYCSFVSDSLLPGQDAVAVTLPQFRVLVQKLSLLSLSPGSQNVSVSTPRSLLETLNGDIANSFTVPVDGRSASNKTSLSVALTTLRSELFNKEMSLTGTEQLFSNPLTVELSDVLCSDPACRFEMVIQTASGLPTNALVKTEEKSYNTTCARGDHSTIAHDCPDSSTISATCNGTAAYIVTSRCPVTSYTPVCNAVAGLGVSSTDCQVVASTGTSITCSCPLTAAAGAGGAVGARRSRSRNLQAGTTEDTDDSAAASSETSVSYVAMLSEVKNNFVDTITSADDLNASTLEKGWSALLTIGLLSATIVFGLHWSYHADKDMGKKVKPSTKKGSEKANSDTDNRFQFVKNCAAGMVKKFSRGKIRVVAPTSNWHVNKDVQIAEQALPSILSSNSLSNRVKDELKHRHKWFGIVFYFSRSFPRVLRVLSLATNVIIMLFIQSITYSLTNPDDGTCELYQAKPDCLAPDSPYATGESKCSWHAEAGECALKQPDSDMKVILFVAIFSALLCTPLALLVDWIIMFVLSAPTKAPPTASSLASIAPAAGANTINVRPRGRHRSQQAEQSLNTNVSIVPAGEQQQPAATTSSRKRSSMSGSIFGSVFGSVLGWGGRGSGDASASEEQLVSVSAHSDLRELVRELTAYRNTLTAEQKVEFDAIWGLDENGYFLAGEDASRQSMLKRLSRFMNPSPQSNRSSGTAGPGSNAQRVLLDLKSVHAHLLSEARAAEELHMSDKEKGKRLLFLFQKDLLPGISGKILESKGQRDNIAAPQVSWEAKAAGWTFIGLLNVGMLFYILLFALSQTSHRQGAWALSFVLWLVVEIIFVSSMTVLFTHIIVPSLIMEDVNKIKLKLAESIRAFNQGVRRKNKGSALEGPENFNAASYLFVSTRLAKQWSDLREAQIIAQFRTPWPKQSYQREADVSQGYSKKYAALTRSASIIAIFFLTQMLQVPPALQDMVIHMTTTAVMGYTVLLHLDLYQVYSALVILPCLLIAVVVHFIVQANRATAKAKLQKLLGPGDSDSTFIDEEKSTERDDSLALNRDTTTKFNDQGLMKSEMESNGLAFEGAAAADYRDDIHVAGELHMPLPASYAPAPKKGQHASRKQSVQLGLNVLHSLKQHQQQQRTQPYEESKTEEGKKKDTDCAAACQPVSPSPPTLKKDESITSLTPSEELAFEQAFTPEVLSRKSVAQVLANLDEIAPPDRDVVQVGVGRLSSRDYESTRLRASTESGSSEGSDGESSEGEEEEEEEGSEEGSDGEGSEEGSEEESGEDSGEGSEEDSEEGSEEDSGEDSGEENNNIKNKNRTQGSVRTVVPQRVSAEEGNFVDSGVTLFKSEADISGAEGSDAESDSMFDSPSELSFN